MFIITIFISGKGHYQESDGQEASQELPLLSGSGQDKRLIPSTACEVPDAVAPAFSPISTHALSPAHCGPDTLPFSLLCSLSTSMSSFPPQFHTRLPSAWSATPPLHFTWLAPSRLTSLA